MQTPSLVHRDSDINSALYSIQNPLSLVHLPSMILKNLFTHNYYIDTIIMVIILG